MEPNHTAETITEAFGWTEEQVAEQRSLYLTIVTKYCSIEGYSTSKMISEVAHCDLETVEEKISLALKIERAKDTFFSMMKAAIVGDKRF